MDTSLLQQAVTAIKTNDKVTGRKLLLEFLRDNREHEQALLWLSATTENLAEKRHYFEHVLKINPNNQNAKWALAKLDELDPEVTPLEAMTVHPTKTLRLPPVPTPARPAPVTPTPASTPEPKKWYSSLAFKISTFISSKKT
jgi:hypothetical protein